MILKNIITYKISIYYNTCKNFVMFVFVVLSYCLNVHIHFVRLLHIVVHAQQTHSIVLCIKLRLSVQTAHFLGNIIINPNIKSICCGTKYFSDLTQPVASLVQQLCARIQGHYKYYKHEFQKSMYLFFTNLFI